MKRHFGSIGIGKMQLCQYVHLNVFFFSPAIFKWAPDHHRRNLYIQFDLIRLLDWFLIVVSCVHVRMAGILVLCGQNQSNAKQNVDTNSQSIRLIVTPFNIRRSGPLNIVILVGVSNAFVCNCVYNDDCFFSYFIFVRFDLMNCLVYCLEMCTNKSSET